MIARVTAADLFAAQLALEHEAETYNEAEEDEESPYGALLRVAEWLERERYRRYRKMGERTIRGPLGIHARQIEERR